MSRIWDDVNYRYIDAEIVWSGKGPLPGIGALERREHYLTAASRECGSGPAGLPSKREMVGKTELDGMQVRQVRTGRPRNPKNPPPQCYLCVSLRATCRRCKGKDSQRRVAETKPRQPDGTYGRKSRREAA